MPATRSRISPPTSPPDVAKWERRHGGSPLPVTNLPRIEDDDYSVARSDPSRAGAQGLTILRCGQAWAERANGILARAERENRDLLASELRDFDEAARQAEGFGETWERIDAHNREMAEARRFVPVGDGGRREAARGPVLAPEQRMSDWAGHHGLGGHHEGELRFDRWVRGIVSGDWTGADAERRAMGEGVLAGGGYVVPTPLALEIIDRARQQARVLQAGARTVPMTSQTLKIGRVAGDPSASWHAEHEIIAESDMTFEQVELRAKTLTSIVRASRELLEDGNDVQGTLRDAFAAQLALALDRASLYGSGVAPEPRGAKNTTGVVLQPRGANGGLIDWDVLVDAVGALWDANETPTAIIDAPRTERSLAKLKDAQGQYLRPPDMLANLPRYATNQVPTDLTMGTANNTSDAFVGDWKQLLIGVRAGFAIEVLKERYADRFEIGFLAHLRADVALARPAGVVVVTGIIP
jgi:HK97 family phage major capsid protein